MIIGQCTSAFFTGTLNGSLHDHVTSSNQLNQLYGNNPPQSLPQMPFPYAATDWLTKPLIILFTPITC